MLFKDDKDFPVERLGDARIQYSEIPKVIEYLQTVYKERVKA